MIELARDSLNPDLEWLGVVLNIADMRTRHSREAFDSLREHFGDKLLDTTIRASIAYAESAERALSILDYRPDLGGRLPGRRRRAAAAAGARRPPAQAAAGAGGAATGPPARSADAAELLTSASRTSAPWDSNGARACTVAQRLRLARRAPRPRAPVCS